MRKPLRDGFRERAPSAGNARSQKQDGTASELPPIGWEFPPLRRAGYRTVMAGNEGMSDERSVPKPGGTAGILPAPAAKPLPGRFLIPGAEKEWNFLW